MIELSQYGTVIQKYGGTGQLLQENYAALDCDFELAQFVDGAIRLICSVPSLPVPQIEGEIGSIGQVCFQGQTDDNVPIKIEGTLLQILSNIEWGQTNLAQVVFIGTGQVKLQVGHPDWSDEVELRFGITNFLFVGNDGELIMPNSWRQNKLGRVLKLQNDGLS